MTEHESRLRELLPGAEIHLTGSACVPGLDPNDLDFVALVEDVPAAAETLKSVYPTLYADDWREDWAAFRDPGPPQIDVVLTRRGSWGDSHHRLAWQLLADRPDLLEEYRALKATPQDYALRKQEFFERVVALL